MSPSRRLRVLAINPLFPNPVQPNRGMFVASALAHLSRRANVRVVSPVRWWPGQRWAPSPERILARVPGWR